MNLIKVYMLAETLSYPEGNNPDYKGQVHGMMFNDVLFPQGRFYLDSFIQPLPPETKNDLKDPESEEEFEEETEVPLESAEKTQLNQHLKCCAYRYDKKTHTLTIVHPLLTVAQTKNIHSESIIPKTKTTNNAENAILGFLGLNKKSIQINSFTPYVLPGAMKAITGNDHIKLRVDQTDNGEQKQAFLVDPREVAQGFANDTDCGRYVLAMIDEACQMDTCKPITKETMIEQFKDSPVVNRIDRAKTTSQLQAVISNPAEPDNKFKNTLVKMKAIYMAELANNPTKQKIKTFFSDTTATKKIEAIMSILEMIKNNERGNLHDLPKAAIDGKLGKFIKENWSKYWNSIPNPHIP